MTIVSKKKETKFEIFGNVEKDSEVVVLYHENDGIDVLAKKDLKKKKPKLFEKMSERGYQVRRCPFARHFMKNHEGYEHVFSEDLNHIPYFNASVVDLLLWLGKKFKTSVVLVERRENK